MKTEKGRITVNIDGPEVGHGKIEVTAFTEVVQGLYQSIRAVASNLVKGPRGGTGRYPKPVEDYCRLAISNWSDHSVRFDLEMIAAQKDSLFDLVDDALDQLVEGVANLPKSKTVLPKGFDVGVVSGIEKLSSTLTSKHLTRITLRKAGGGAGKEGVIDRAVVHHVMELVRKAEACSVMLEGKFYQLNLKQRTATVESLEKGSVVCDFGEETEMQIIEGLKHPVRVHGTASEDPMTKKLSRLKVRLVERMPETARHRGRKPPPPSPEQDPILMLSGLGKEIWAGVDPDRYVQELREGWE